MIKATTPTDIKGSEDIIKSFAMTMRQTSLYGFDHKLVKDHIINLFSILSDLLSREKNLLINSVDGKLLVNGEALSDSNPVFEGFIKFLDKNELDSFTFRSGISKDELTSFFKLLAESADILHDEGIDEILDEKWIRHIKLNKVHYAKVDEDESVAKASATEEGRTDISSFEEEPKLEFLIHKIVARVSPDPDIQEKLFEIVMERLQSEVEDKVAEATKEISDEKDLALFQKGTTEAVFDNMAGGVVVVDDDGKIIMLNQTAQDLMEGKRVGETLTDDLRDEHMVVFTREFSAESGGLERDIDVSGDKETEHTLRSSSAIIQDKKGRPVGIVTSLNDITRQKELMRMKENFVSSVSHELRTPLAIIKQNLSILLEGIAGDINEKQGKVLFLAKKNVDRLSRLVNDVLDFSKFRAGRMKLNPEESDLEELLNEVVETYKGWAEEKGVMIGSAHAGFYPLMIFDRDKIMQVVTNLVSNSIKFTNRGGKIEVISRFKALSAGGRGSLLVSVRDTGAGIGCEDLEKIFDEFYQAKGNTSTGAKGTGLGLPISKKIIELHGGKIRVESEDGEGSSFSFSIPVHVVERAKVEDKRLRYSLFEKLFGKFHLIFGK